MATGGAGEHQGPDPVGVPHGEELGDDPAHRRPHHVGRGDAGVVEDGDRVGGHDLDVVGGGRLAGTACAPVVEHDHPVEPSEGPALEQPSPDVGAETLDQEDGLPGRGSEDLVAQPGAVRGRGEWHVHTLPTFRGQPVDNADAERALRGRGGP